MNLGIIIFGRVTIYPRYLLGIFGNKDLVLYGCVNELITNSKHYFIFKISTNNVIKTNKSTIKIKNHILNRISLISIYTIIDHNIINF